MDYESKLHDGNKVAVEPLITFNEGKFANVRLWGPRDCFSCNLNWTATT